MSLQFGRAGVSDGVTLGEHSTFLLGRAPTARMEAGQKVAGEDDVTISGWITASNQNDANALRQQFLGHFRNDDEPQIPIVWGSDPTQNGFYEPVTGDAESVLGISYTAGGGYGFKYQAKVQRVASYNAPKIESRVSGSVLTNDFGVVLANTMPWHGIPSTSKGYDFGGRGDSAVARVGPGGTFNHYSSGQLYMTGNPSWYTPTANYYDMAATIKVGSTLRTVVGRQIVSAGNENNWEISNGLTKIVGATSGTSMLKMYHPVYASPSGWGTATSIDIGYYGFFGWTTIPYSQIDAISIKRNSPELCVLRLTIHFVPNSAGSTQYATLDISLRRGDRTARLTMQSPIHEKWGVAVTGGSVGVDTMTYGSGVAGIRKTAADGDGNKFCFFTSHTNTRDTSNAIIYATSAQAIMDVGLSSEVGGASAVTPDDSSSLIFQYYAPQYEYQRVVLP